MEPKYKHDRTDCIYLGHFNGDDLYAVENGKGKLQNLIARQSSIPEDYIAGLENIGNCHSITLASNRYMDYKRLSVPVFKTA